MNKIPASLRSDFSDCRFAPQCVPVCFGIGGDFSGIRTEQSGRVIRAKAAGGRSEATLEFFS